MVNGKPYISVNNATMKAEYMPNERQSLFVCGLAKLNAKIINMVELIITNDQSPQSEAVPGSMIIPPYEVNGHHANHGYDHDYHA